MNKQQEAASKAKSKCSETCDKKISYNRNYLKPATALKTQIKIKRKLNELSIGVLSIEIPK